MVHEALDDSHPSSRNRPDFEILIPWRPQPDGTLPHSVPMRPTFGPVVNRLVMLDSMDPVKA
jgi:hypothetical protein